MKIKTRLTLNFFISLGGLILIMLSLGWSFREMSRATSNMDMVEEMRKVAFERITLRDDYLLYQEERSRTQWFAKSETLRELFETASESFTDVEDKALLIDARKDFDATLSIFSQFMEDHKREGRTAKKGFDLTEAETRQVGQVFLKAYALSDSIGRLHESALRKRTTARDRGSLAVVVAIIGSVFMTFLNSSIINRILTKRIAALSKGVEIIGGGNLDYRIVVEGDDEFSALAIASNEMAVKLGRSYTSITDLAKEIERRKQMEEALQESERRLREAQKMAQLGYWNWDVRSGVVEWSEEVYNIFDLDPNEFTPQIDSILALSPWPEDHERDRELIRTAMESHEKGDYEQRFLRPDGSTGYYYSTFQGKYDAEGNLISIVGTVLDITERKLAEETLRLAHQRLRRFVDSNIVGIIIASPDGQIVEANDYYLRLIGFTREELDSGKVDWRAITPPEWLPVDEQAIRELRERGACTPYEKEYVRRDGTRVPVFLADTLLPGPEEQIAAFALDLTERKAAEAQIQRTMADLERSNKELEQFAYVASHDLQEPLRMVASYTQLLAQRYEGQLDDKARKFIDYAVDGAVRMQRLINDLLAYSRVNTQGKAFETIDSHAVLGEALRNLSSAIEENRAIVMNDDLPLVRADPTQLSQLFLNLIGNAIKFRSDEPPRIRVSADDLGREWRFSVKDNGIGIDTQYTDKVFVIFQRLHTRQEYSGTGIGLAICKRIVERHVGRIWFESEPGKGSTFYFTLPK